MKEQKCSLFTNYSEEERGDIFFSTTWCRDRLFSSDNNSEIISVYDTFRSTDELFQWMRDRPKGRAEIFEIEGNKEVIVVIPTADFEGKYAKECRENIFKGLHIIFVESGYPKDPYFNYSHSCNIGIKTALKYNPKWIVVSNDDMYKIDDVERLKRELRALDNKMIYVVFTKPSRYHSIPDNFGRPRITRKILFSLLPKRRIQIKAEKKIGINNFPSPSFRYHIFFYKRGYRYLSIADFGIFSSEFIKHSGCTLFDEIFVTGGEDNDLSLRLSMFSERHAIIEYRIGDYMGSSLGKGVARHLRNVLNLCYLEYKIENEMDGLSRSILQ